MKDQAFNWMKLLRSLNKETLSCSPSTSREPLTSYVFLKTRDKRKNNNVAVSYHGPVGRNLVQTRKTMFITWNCTSCLIIALCVLNPMYRMFDDNTPLPTKSLRITS